jgi:hypothetical protein
LPPKIKRYCLEALGAGESYVIKEHIDASKLIDALLLQTLNLVFTGSIIKSGNYFHSQRRSFLLCFLQRLTVVERTQQEVGSLPRESERRTLAQRGSRFAYEYVLTL